MRRFTIVLALAAALLSCCSLVGAVTGVVNRCGKSYSDAGTKCKKCPRGVDSECPSGETCYAGLPDCQSKTINRCGKTYSDAQSKCRKCPRGLDKDCGQDETCFAGLPPCTSSQPSPSPSPTPSPNPPPTSSGCKAPNNPYGPQAKSACTGSPFCWTKRARWLKNKIEACFNLECTTYASGSSSDHEGNAVDCWSKRGRPCPASGAAKSDMDELAAWAIKLSNARPAEIGFVNWRQRQWSQARASSGWRSYGSRGSCTANHYDHVHISVCAGGYNAYNYGC